MAVLRLFHRPNLRPTVDDRKIRLFPSHKMTNNMLLWLHFGFQAKQHDGSVDRTTSRCRQTFPKSGMQNRSTKQKIIFKKRLYLKWHKLFAKQRNRENPNDKSTNGIENHSSGGRQTFSNTNTGKIKECNTKIYVASISSIFVT